MSENALLKSILDKFFEEIRNDNTVPSSLGEKLQKLRDDGKIAKGAHLKTLLEEFEVEVKDENSKS